MKNILNKKRLMICGAGGGGGGGGSAPPPPPPPVITQYPGVLAPPQMGQLNTLASFSYAEMIDLLSDGPIDGLVNKFGRKVYDENIFEGIYFNDTPIKETSTSQIFNFSIQNLKNYLINHFDYFSGQSFLQDTNFPRVTPINAYIDINGNSYLGPGITISSYHPNASISAFINSRGGNVASRDLIQKAFDKSPVYDEKPFLTIIDIPSMNVIFPEGTFDTSENGGKNPIQARISNLSENIYFSIGSDNLTSFNYFELPRTFLANDSTNSAGKKTFSKSIISYGNFSASNLKIYIWSIYGNEGIKNINTILDKYFTKIIFHQNKQSLYNFNLVESEFRSGSEVQAPLNYFDSVSIDTEYKQSLFGAYLVKNNFTPNSAIAAGGVQRLLALCFTPGICPPVNLSLEDETSDDIRYIKTWPLEYDCKGNPFIISNARVNYTQFDKTSSTRTSQEAIPITHYIANENVEQVYITLGIDQLFDTNHIDMVSLNSVINGTKSLTAADVIGGIGTYAQLPGNYIYGGSNAALASSASYQKVTRSDDGQISTTAACDFSMVQQQVTAGTKLPTIVSVKVETGYENCESTYIGDYYSYKYDIFGIGSQTFVDLGRKNYPFVFSQQLNSINSPTYGQSRINFEMKFWVLYNCTTQQGQLIFMPASSYNNYAGYSCTCIQEINFGQLLNDYNGGFQIEYKTHQESYTAYDHCGNPYTDYYTATDYLSLGSTKDIYIKSYGNLFSNNQPLVDGNWKYIPGLNYVTAGKEWVDMGLGYVAYRNLDGAFVRPTYYLNDATSQTITFPTLGSLSSYTINKINFTAPNYDSLTWNCFKYLFKIYGCIPSDIDFVGGVMCQNVNLDGNKVVTTSAQRWVDGYYDNNDNYHDGYYETDYTSTNVSLANVLKIEYFQVCATNLWDGTWQATSSDSIKLPAAKLDAYGKSIRRYVKVTKLSHETLSSLIQKSINLNKVTEIIPQRFSYPFSAIVGTKIDSRAFSQVPNRTFDAKLKKVLIPSNYFAFNEDGDDLRYTTSNGAACIYQGDWDGTFKLAWTNNPAWILMDLLVNKRYGLGNYIESNQIDIWELYKISRWCDKVDDNGFYYGVPDTYGGIEPRFTFNVLIKDRFNLFDMLNQVASTFRGSVYYMNSLITFDCDRIKPPIGEFTNNDVKEGIFNYTNHKKDDEFTAVDVSYMDSKDNFKPKIEYVEDSDGIRKKGILKKSLTTLGTTSRGQARRIGKHFLYQVGKELTNVTFTTDLKALLYKPGDLLYIKDEMYNANKNFGYIKDIKNIDDNSFKVVIDTILDSGIYNTNEISLYTPVAKPKYEDMKSYTTSTPNTFSIDKNFLNVFARRGSLTTCAFFGTATPFTSTYNSYLNGVLNTSVNGWCGLLSDINYTTETLSSISDIINYYKINACFTYLPAHPVYKTPDSSTKCCYIDCVSVFLCYVKGKDIYNNASDGFWQMNSSVAVVKFDTTNKNIENTSANLPYIWEYFNTAVLCLMNYNGGYTTNDYTSAIFFNPKSNYTFFNNTNLIPSFNILTYNKNTIPYNSLIESDRPSIESFYITGYSTGSYSGIYTGIYTEKGGYNQYTELYVTKSGKNTTLSDNGYFGSNNSSLNYTNNFSKIKTSYDPLCIPIGSTYSLNILNKKNKIFKINSISENYINEYNIVAAEYDSNKFKEIEEGAYIDNLENTFNFLNAYNASSQAIKANYLTTPIIIDLSLIQFNGSSYLSLQWNAVLNAKTYTVYVKTPSKQTQNFIATINADSIDRNTNKYIYNYQLPAIYEQGSYTLGVQASAPFVDVAPSVVGSLYSFSPETTRSITLITY